jgi:hypothetical protein
MMKSVALADSTMIHSSSPESDWIVLSNDSDDDDDEYDYCDDACSVHSSPQSFIKDSQRLQAPLDEEHYGIPLLVHTPPPPSLIEESPEEDEIPSIYGNKNNDGSDPPTDEEVKDLLENIFEQDFTSKKLREESKQATIVLQDSSPGLPVVDSTSNALLIESTLNSGSSQSSSALDNDSDDGTLNHSSYMTESREDSIVELLEKHMYHSKSRLCNKKRRKQLKLAKQRPAATAAVSRLLVTPARKGRRNNKVAAVVCAAESIASYNNTKSSNSSKQMKKLMRSL